METVKNLIQSADQALHLVSEGPHVQTNATSDTALVLTRGTVWTGVDALSGGTIMAEAFAYNTANGKILRVGSCDDIIREFGTEESASVIDLRACEPDDVMVTPGFHDSHVHIVVGGKIEQGVSFEGCGNRVSFAAKLAAHYAKWQMFSHHHEKLEESDIIENEDWVIGGGLSQEIFGRDITKELIDAVVANTPCFIFTTDLHAALVNSEALKRANITKETKSPEGGTIERDEDGEPTGLLRDEAVGLVQKKIPQHHMLSALYHAVDHLSKQGITSIAHMGAGPNMYKQHGTWDEISVFEKADAKGKHHQLRIYSAVELETHKDLAHKIKTDLKGSFEESPYLRLGLLKAYADGAQGSATALEYEHYTGGKTNPEEREYPHGKRVIQLDEIRSQAKQAIEEGLNVAIHCIGDHACHDIVCLFEEIVREYKAKHPDSHDLLPHRLRIEHGHHLRPEDLERLASIKDHVSVCVNPQHISSSVKEVEELLKPEDRDQFRNIFRIRSLIDRGILVCFGSDWPIAPASPLYAIWIAMQRIPSNSNKTFFPQESVTVEQALKCLTINAAKMQGVGDRIGLIQEGYEADFTVFNRNLLRASPDEIKNTKVLLTAVRGDIKFCNLPTSSA